MADDAPSRDGRRRIRRLPRSSARHARRSGRRCAGAAWSSTARTARRRRWRHDCFARWASRSCCSARRRTGATSTSGAARRTRNRWRRRVPEVGAIAGVAFDGDGDRAIFADERGRIVDGDAVMLMCARQLKTRRAPARRHRRRHGDEQHRPRDRAGGIGHCAAARRRSATST